MTELLITNATLVNDKETFAADLLVRDEKIALVGKNLIAPGAQVLDATGKLLLPGGVDAHTHFDLPMFGTVSSDDHYTGHKAAAFGGTTTVLDFVSFDAPTLAGSVEAWRRKAEKAAIDYSFHMNLTRFDDAVAGEIPALVEMGITTLKVFTAYNGRLRIDDGSIFKALRIARQHGMLVMAHCESGDVIETLVAEALAQGHTAPEWHARTRPAWGAVEAALRLCSLAAQAEAPLYIVHMNVGGEVDMLAYAREHGVQAMGETCPQYLFFTEDDLRRPDGAKWICSPPVRTSADNDRLWQGLQAGTIQTLATDHCPFFFDGTQPILYEGAPVAIPGKELGNADFTRIPNGLPGVGDRLPVLWTTGVGSGRLSMPQFVTLTAANPARIFGLYPRKGALLPGSDADLVLWDPGRKVRYGVSYSHQRTDYNLYEGWELTGMPEKVFLRGRLIVDGEQWLGERGMGQFLPRQPFAPVL
jgi:dihydropyrimidinase